MWWGKGGKVKRLKDKGVVGESVRRRKRRGERERQKEIR